MIPLPALAELVPDGALLALAAGNSLPSCALVRALSGAARATCGCSASPSPASSPTC